MRLPAQLSKVTTTLTAGRRRWAAAVAVGALACAAAAGAASLRGEPSAGVLKVRVGGDARQTRVMVELDRAATGRLLKGADPGRTVILALPHVESAGDMAGQGAGLVRAWTVDQAAGAARVRLELVRDARVSRRFLLPPGDGFDAWRYVIDVTEERAAPVLPRAQKLSPERVTARVPEPPRAMAPVQIALDLPSSSRKVIVIDAGHGGKDPGAAGEGQREKAITLAAARQLRDRLERGGRYKVVLTRTADTFVPLGERVRIARRANADLFISLHADSGTDAEMRGATVYTLSQQGADRVAEHAMGRESWFMRVNMPGADAQVNRILLDLTQRQARNRSSTFANVLLDKISDRTVLLKHGHRDAGFVVLLAPEVPAVLLEMGFITNVQDERLLADPARRRRLMDAVGDSIDSYFTRERTIASR